MAVVAGRLERWTWARVAAPIAWSLWVLGAGVGVLRWLLGNLAPELGMSPVGGALADLAGLILPLAFPTVGALIATRRPGHPVGWLFLVVGLGFGVKDLTSGYAGYALLVRPGELPGAELAAWLKPVSEQISVGLLVLVVLLFPDGRLPSRRWRPLACAVGAWTAVGVVVRAFGPLPIPVAGGVLVPNPLAVQGLVGDGLVLVSGVLPALGPVLLAAAAASVLLRLRRAEGEPRQQLKWFASALVLVSLLVGANGVLMARYASAGAMPPWASVVLLLMLVSVCLVPISAGIAILRYRLYDIDLLINRGLVYGGLTACVVGLYVLAVALIGRLLRDEDLLVSLLATGVVAVVFQPLRARLQRAVNRLLYGERDDPYTVLSRLDHRLADTLAPAQVLPTIAETIAQALKLSYAAIALGQDQRLEVVAEHGRPSGGELMLPLVYQGESIGELRLGPRAPGEALNDADRRLLEGLARHLGAAAHAVRLTADLQHARERLVAAREEERRRLRRDLHDGLGPQLASMTLQAEAARDALTDEPRQADALLDDLTRQLQAATGEIRRLVYELRPPALDDLGLVGALRAHADRYDRGGFRVVVDAPAQLPPLPAAVEVAAYRIAMEALTNVGRHAGARSCALRLGVVAQNGRGPALELAVVDDGRGVDPGAPAGVGLASMRERAAELGGSCVLEPVAVGGTRVVARLPLDAASSAGR